jgi:hypothetical protein
LALLMLVPGFIYVTFQNFGNDAQWLSMLAILLFCMLPEAGSINRQAVNLRMGVIVTGVCALVMAVPSLFNLASSPYRHLGLNAGWYQPILPQNGAHSDIQALTVRSSRVETLTVRDGGGRVGAFGQGVTA